MVFRIDGAKITEIGEVYEIYEPLIPDNRKIDFLDIFMETGKPPETLALAFLHVFSDLTITDVVNYTSGIGNMSEPAIEYQKDNLLEELDLDDPDNEFDEVPSPKEYRDHRHEWLKEHGGNIEERPHREKLENLTENRSKILQDMYNDSPKEVQNILYGTFPHNDSMIDELRQMEKYTGWVECIDERKDRKDTHANVYRLTEEGRKAYETLQKLMEEEKEV